MKFKRVYIEITNICNLSCRFCPKTKRKSEFLKVEKFKYILEQLKGYTKYVYFHLMGEPLLNKNIVDFFEIAEEEGFNVNITTNGTLLKKQGHILKKAKALKQINISLHSFEANEANISFTEYLNDVLNFVNEFNLVSSGIVSLRLWNLDSYNLNGENSLNKDIVNIISEKFNCKEDLREGLKEGKSVKVKERVYINMGEKFQWPSLDANYLGEEGFCQGLRSHIGILVDGTVVPCCLDGEGVIDLGNIYKEKLDDILAKKRTKEIYDNFSNRKRSEELCKRCGYSQVFNKK